MNYIFEFVEFSLKSQNHLEYTWVALGHDNILTERGWWKGFVSIYNLYCDLSQILSQPTSTRVSDLQKV